MFLCIFILNVQLLNIYDRNCLTWNFYEFLFLVLCFKIFSFLKTKCSSFLSWCCSVLWYSVHLVELRGTGELYAMKAMEKSVMLNRNKVWICKRVISLLPLKDFCMLPISCWESSGWYILMKYNMLFLSCFHLCQV